MRQLSVVLLGLILLGCGKEEPGPDAQYSERMAQEHRHDTPVASPAAQKGTAAPIRSQTVVYAKVGGKDVSGYFAYPANAEGGLPAVLVIHEWWGLNDNIRSMADQLAGEGYAALALDLYGGQVGATPEAARGLMEATFKDPAGVSQNLAQAHAYLSGEIKAARIGSVGWCYGGGMSLKAGLELADRLDAVVVYYGHVSSDPEQLKALKAPLLGVFGGADQGIPVESVKSFEAALKSLGKSAEIHIYDGAGHGFANPSGTSYKADAAEDAWKRTLEFLAAHLKGP